MATRPLESWVVPNQPFGDEVAGNGSPPFAAVLGCEHLAGARDVGGL